MLKLVSSRKYAGLRASQDELRGSVEALRRENAELRERLAAAYKARDGSAKTAEELRKEKERLRLRVTEQKRSLDQQRRINDRLTEKISALRAENASLLERLPPS